MLTNHAPQIWEFDTDDTLVMWDVSSYPDLDDVWVDTPKGSAHLKINQKQVNLLVKLAKVGWFIRVYSGSGANWAASVVQALSIEQYVDECAYKPRGRSDDRPLGDGLAYNVYRDPRTGKED